MASLPPGAGLRKFLKEHVVSKEVQDTLAVADKALGGLIKDKLGIQCAHDAAINELYRGIRAQLTSLISGASPGRTPGTLSATLRANSLNRSLCVWRLFQACRRASSTRWCSVYRTACRGTSSSSARTKSTP